MYPSTAAQIYSIQPQRRGEKSRWETRLKDALKRRAEKTLKMTR
jgi:hypothetical protein